MPANRADRIARERTWDRKVHEAARERDTELYRTTNHLDVIAALRKLIPVTLDLLEQHGYPDMIQVRTEEPRLRFGTKRFGYHHVGRAAWRLGSQQLECYGEHLDRDIDLLSTGEIGCEPVTGTVMVARTLDEIAKDPTNYESMAQIALNGLLQLGQGLRNPSAR